MGQGYRDGVEECGLWVSNEVYKGSLPLGRNMGLKLCLGLWGTNLESKLMLLTYNLIFVVTLGCLFVEVKVKQHCCLVYSTYLTQNYNSLGPKT